MNQKVENTSRGLENVSVIASQLRVPELSYRMDGVEALSEDIQTYFMALTYESVSGVDSVLKHLSTTLDKKSLPVLLNNYAFIADRIYDVWGRKNKLSEEISEILKIWRYPFFTLMHQTKDMSQVGTFIALIDRVASDTLGWEPRPERSKRIFLDELQSITAALFELDGMAEAPLIALLDRWELFISKQSRRATKVVERLKVIEARQSWAEYCDLYAKKYVETLFLKQQVTQSLQTFMADYWVQVLAQSIEKQINPQIDESKQTLTARIKAVFCTKGKSAFKWVDNLLEEMQAECETYNLNINDSVWEALQHDLVNILQGSSLEESLFVGSDDTKAWVKPTLVDLNSQISEGEWFRFVKSSQRAQVIAIYPETQEVLFCNYLGIKLHRYTYAELNAALLSQELKTLAVESTFLEVVQKTSVGLLKVSDTQKKARIVAAEKAKNEAERLLAEKQQAEKIAQIKAEKLAALAKQRLQEQIDKERVAQEQAAFTQVSHCKLGTWVSIKQDDESAETRTLRFKLVVKFAATNKFIFVDKLGVKKIEYTEADLVEGIINKNIEILSDGVEFEESLERVVSRLRISK